MNEGLPEPPFRRLPTMVQGRGRLVQNYAVDGIHLTTTSTPPPILPLTRRSFAASGEADLTAWRRANDPAGQSCPRCRQGRRPDPAVRGQLQGQRTTTGTGSTDLSVWLTAPGADAVVVTSAPDLLGLWLYPLLRQHPLPLRTSPPVAGPAPAEARPSGFGLGAYRVGVGDGGASADSVSQWCRQRAVGR